MKKTAFIIGTGPSLRDVDVTKLKSCTTMTFNRAYISYEDWGFEPTYYMCIDQNDLNSYYSDVNELIANTSTEKYFLCDLGKDSPLFMIYQSLTRLWWAIKGFIVPNIIQNMATSI